MKKLLMLSVVMIAMICFVQNAKAQSASASFNLSMTVDKYIETMPNPVSFNLGTTSQREYDPNRRSLAASSPRYNLAYANCGFSVTVSGNNPAGQLKPRFARQELGAHAGGFDFLPTQYSIAITTNGVQDWLYGFAGTPNRASAESFPISKDYSEAPHNGQVAMDMSFYVNCNAEPTVPLRMTLIDPTFTKEQSADAGDYTCTLVVTLAAL